MDSVRRTRTTPAPCPEWCRTSAAEHATEDPGARLHEGTPFGLVRTWWLDGPTPAFTATVSESAGGDLSSDDLRRLATDSLDAAMRMDREARRVESSAPGLSVVELVRRAHHQSSRSA